MVAISFSSIFWSERTRMKESRISGSEEASTRSINLIFRMRKVVYRKIKKWQIDTLFSSIYGYRHPHLWTDPRTHTGYGTHAHTCTLRAEEYETIRHQVIEESDPRRTLWEDPPCTPRFSICSERYGIHRQGMRLYHIRWAYRRTITRNNLPRTQKWKCKTQPKWSHDKKYHRP